MENNLNIKHYSDYRGFLKDHFEMKKARNPAWSYGLWARRLGLKSTSSLTKILTGEREPGKVVTDKFAQYFSFDVVETSYFSDLIRLSKVEEDVRLKVMLLERMGREHPDARLRVLDDKSFDVISNWWCMTIREMVRLEDFREDLAWIQARLSHEVSTEEIKKAIVNLLHQGLLKRSVDGKLVSSQGILTTTNDVASEAIKRYHEQTLDKAKESIREVSVELREVTAETLTINSKNIPLAKELIREFKAKFARLLEEQQGDETYQLQIQFYPMTKEIRHEN